MNVEVRCTGCGGVLATLERGATPEEDQRLLASVQESPPFCVVCSCRIMACPRPGVEVWEQGIGHSSARREEVMVSSGDPRGADSPELHRLHDEVGY